ncbi:hypothetical protein NBRC116188_27620 [Oceaniserpentilla sp. 4NH20-0058]|uniref:hypothetical protein n=1 Tax=Oceaniserpentilla sp. 4NH20-0058 TaxID=3127660 RepID=UPI003104AF00
MKYILVIVINSLYFNNSQAFNFVGIAYDLNTENIIYYENHTVILNKEGQYKRANVVYKYPSGEEFANKELIFSSPLTIPSFDFDNFYSHTKINLKNLNGVAYLRYESEGVSISKSFEVSDYLVADAGFDQLVIKNWDLLVSGNVLKFHFIVPSRGEAVSFRLLTKSINKSVITFILQPENWLFRLLVDDITLVYGKYDKRIKEYIGLTNIEKISDGELTGDYYKARIKYQY